MASAYTTPVLATSNLPAHLRVQVVILREDGRDLTEEDVAAARAAYPPPTGAEDVGVIGTERPSTSKGARPKARKVGGKVRGDTKTAKRAAARRRAR
jgi:hypothetical protein